MLDAQENHSGKMLDAQESHSGKMLDAQEQAYDVANARVTLGPASSNSLRHDPKHLAFVLARYKFCAKMLEGKAAVMDIGCGDAFGLPILAQAVGRVYAVDRNGPLVEDDHYRLKDHCGAVKFIHADVADWTLPERPLCDAAITLDVLEHIAPENEDAFMRGILECLGSNGTLIIGMPNVTAAPYASPQSQAGHINLKTGAELRAFASRYFKHVFMMGMNDEVVHTGYQPMAHYLLALCCEVK